MADTYLKITLVRSPIGYKKNQSVTAQSLGLRKLNSTVVHKATPQIRGMVFQLRHLLEVEELDNYSAPAKGKAESKSKAKAASAPVEAAPVETAPKKAAPKKAASAPAEAAPKEETPVPAPAEVAAEAIAEAEAPAPKARKSSKTAAAGDDLTKIEGIGPKMSGALKSAGIDTFAKLAASDQDTLKKALEDAGMNLAPSLETWAEQAKFAADGDWDGLKELQGSLVGGRRVN